MNDAILQLLINAKDSASAILKNVGGALHGINETASNVGKQGLQAMNNGFQTTGKIIAGMAIGTVGFLGLIGGAALKGASDFEAGTMKYTTLLGSQEKALQRIKELNKFASETPFQTAEIIKADIILQSFGIRSQKMLNTVGDAAAVSGSSFNDLALIMGQLSQSKGLDNIKQLAQRGIVSFSELKEAGINFSKDGSIENSVEETFQKVNEVMAKKFSGGMEGLSKTFQGKWSTMMDTLNLGLVEIANKIGLVEGAKKGIDLVVYGMEEMKKIVDVLITGDFTKTIFGQMEDSDFVYWIFDVREGFISLTGRVQDAMKYFDQLRQNTILSESVMVGIATVIGVLVVGALAQMAIAIIAATWPFVAIATVAGGLFYLFKTNQPLFYAVATAIGYIAAVIIASYIPAMWSAATAVIAATWPLVAIAVAIGAVVFALVWLYQNWDMVTKFISSVWAIMCDWVILKSNELWSTAVAIFNEILTNITTTLNELWAATVAIFNGILTSITAALNTIWLTTVAIGNSIVAGVMATFNALINWWSFWFLTFYALFTGDFNLLKAVWAGVVNAIVTTWDWMVRTVIMMAVNFGTAIVTTFNNLVATTIASWEWMVRTVVIGAINLGISVINTFNYLVATTIASWEWLKAGTISNWNSLVNSIITTVTSLPGLIRNIWESMLQSISDLGGQIKGTSTSVFNEVKDAIINSFNAVRSIDYIQIGKDMIMGMINGVKNMAGSLAGAVGDTVNNAVNQAKSNLGIQSPSRVFMEIGTNTMLGMAKGIRDNSDMPAVAVEQSTSQMVDSVQAPIPASTPSSSNSPLMVFNFSFGHFLGTEKDRREFQEQMEPSMLQILKRNNIIPQDATA